MAAQQHFFVLAREAILEGLQGSRTDSIEGDQLNEWECRWLAQFRGHIESTLCYDKSSSAVDDTAVKVLKALLEQHRQCPSAMPNPAAISSSTHTHANVCRNVLMDNSDSWIATADKELELTMDLGLGCRATLTSFSLRLSPEKTEHHTQPNGKAEAAPRRGPTRFTVEGSTDMKTWCQLAKITSLPWQPGERRTFAMSDEETFRYFRWRFEEVVHSHLAVSGLLPTLRAVAMSPVSSLPDVQFLSVAQLLSEHAARGDFAFDCPGLKSKPPAAKHSSLTSLRPLKRSSMCLVGRITTRPRSVAKLIDQTGLLFLEDDTASMPCSLSQDPQLSRVRTDLEAGRPLDGVVLCLDTNVISCDRLPIHLAKPLARLQQRRLPYVEICRAVPVLTEAVALPPLPSRIYSVEELLDIDRAKLDAGFRIHVRGQITTMSPVVSLGKQLFFMVELSGDTGTSCVVFVKPPRPVMRHSVLIGYQHVLCNVGVTRVRTGKEWCCRKDAQIYALSCAEAAAVASASPTTAPNPPSSEPSLARIHTETISQPVTVSSNRRQLLTKTMPIYEGVVTATQHLHRGHFTVDDGIKVFISHQPATDYCRGIRVGACVRITHAHGVVVKQSLVGLAACSRTAIQVVEHSPLQATYSCWVQFWSPYARMAELLTAAEYAAALELAEKVKRAVVIEDWSGTRRAPSTEDVVGDSSRKANAGGGIIHNVINALHMGSAFAESGRNAITEFCDHENSCHVAYRTVENPSMASELHDLFFVKDLLDACQPHIERNNRPSTLYGVRDYLPRSMLSKVESWQRMSLSQQDLSDKPVIGTLHVEHSSGQLALIDHESSLNILIESAQTDSALPDLVGCVVLFTRYEVIVEGQSLNLSDSNTSQNSTSISLHMDVEHTHVLWREGGPATIDSAGKCSEIKGDAKGRVVETSDEPPSKKAATAGAINSYLCCITQISRRTRRQRDGSYCFTFNGILVPVVDGRQSNPEQARVSLLRCERPHLLKWLPFLQPSMVIKLDASHDTAGRQHVVEDIFQVKTANQDMSVFRAHIGAIPAALMVGDLTASYLDSDSYIHLRGRVLSKELRPLAGQPTEHAVLVTLGGLSSSDTVRLYWECNDDSREALPPLHADITVWNCTYKLNRQGRAYILRNPVTIVTVNSLSMQQSSNASSSRGALSYASSSLSSLYGTAKIKTSCLIVFIHEVRISWSCAACACTIIGGRCPQGCDTTASREGTGSPRHDSNDEGGPTAVGLYRLKANVSGFLDDGSMQVRFFAKDSVATQVLRLGSKDLDDLGRQALSHTGEASLRYRQDEPSVLKAHVEKPSVRRRAFIVCRKYVKSSGAPARDDATRTFWMKGQEYKTLVCDRVTVEVTQLEEATPGHIDKAAWKLLCELESKP